MMAGALFTRSYLQDVDPTGADEVTALVADLWKSIHFDQLLCDGSKHVAANGTGIPMTQVSPNSAAIDED